MWRQNRNDIKVQIYREDSFPGSKLIFQATNRGYRPVTLTKLGFKFPDSTYHYYPVHPPFIEPFYSGSLPIEKTISSKLLAADLVNKPSLKGTVKVKGFFEDSAQRRYFGNSIEIDVDYQREQFRLGG